MTEIVPMDVHGRSRWCEGSAHQSLSAVTVSRMDNSVLNEFDGDFAKICRKSAEMQFHTRISVELVRDRTRRSADDEQPLHRRRARVQSDWPTRRPDITPGRTPSGWSPSSRPRPDDPSTTKSSSTTLTCSDGAMANGERSTTTTPFSWSTSPLRPGRGTR